ncbi:MAG: hypothetical protein IPG17_19370 [Sandaracinaceae bacterium]|nr:hypothetical protein [Sandaracinaceae bacterium]
MRPLRTTSSPSSARASLACLTFALLATAQTGCGGRTGLSPDPDESRSDGGLQDQSISLDGDVPPDGGPEDLGTPDMDVVLPGTIRCRADMLVVAPRRPVQLEAQHGEGLEDVIGGWSVVESTSIVPPELTPPEGLLATLLPAETGRYSVRYEVTSPTGELLSCTLVINAQPVPPVAQCPMSPLTVRVNTPLMVTGTATDDDGLSTLAWSLTSAPMGAQVQLVNGDAGVAEFTSNASGVHRLTFTATDTDGARGTCTLDVRVMTPPTVTCPDSPVQGISQQPVTLTAAAIDERSVVTRGWSVVSQPPMANVSPMPANGNGTTILPPRQGEYVLRYSATDDDGLTSSCDVLVDVANAPPMVVCPEATRGIIDRPLMLTGSATDDEGIASVMWSVTQRPAGAVTSLSPANALATSLLSDTVGPHTLTLTVADADGASASCTVDVLMTAGPRVTCPASPVAAETRSPVTLNATATDDGRVVRTAWQVLSTPMSSTVAPGPYPGLSVTFTPDRVGPYVLEFEAIDDDGLSGTCQVTVEAAPSAPVLTCPAVVTVRPLRPATVTATLVASDAPLTTISWTQGAYPDGSTAGGPSPSNQLSTQITPDIVGEYPLRLDVEDGNGFTAGCDVLVRAVSDEGLRVEVFWDTAGTDMDVHVMDPAGTRWFTPLDCHYANCRSSLPWGGPGTEDNPRLDIDDVNGFGPENINIQEPVPGTYRVAIDAFRGRGNVSVRIYCGGTVTVPVAEFGPSLLAATGFMWRVADVTVRGPGDCTITPVGMPVMEDMTTAPR